MNTTAAPVAPAANTNALPPNAINAPQTGGRRRKASRKASRKNSRKNSLKASRKNRRSSKKSSRRSSRR